MVSTSDLQSRRIDVENSFDAIQDYYDEQGWTDGLPVVPATEELVRRMLAGSTGAPNDSLGIIQPRNGRVTLEKIAINAVMAGCRPEYFPVVVAAVKAMLQDEFNVAGVSSTTGGATPAVIDRKSTRLNSSHVVTSYAVFCLKKKNTPLVSFLLQSYSPPLVFTLSSRNLPIHSYH